MFPIDKTDEWDSMHDPDSMAQPSPLRYVPSITTNGTVTPGMSETEIPEDEIVEIATRVFKDEGWGEPLDLSEGSLCVASVRAGISASSERIAAAEAREQDLLARAEKAEADAQRMYEALGEIAAVASGEKQVATDDTEGMDYIDKLARAAITAYEEK